mgnify:CR=1 FL=1
MTKKNDTVVFTLNNNTKMKMIEYYQDKLRPKTPPYAVFQAEEAGTVITLYTSNKVMFQGENAKEDALLWQEFNKGNDAISEIMNEDKEEGYKNKDDSDSITLPSDITSIGSDEVGTGDYFGPIVVTASYVKKEDIPYLESLGIRDSKKMLDEHILKIVPKIKDKVKHCTIILNNSDYNKVYSSDMNMNKIKAILHNKALYSLVKDNVDYDYIVIDEFASEKNYFGYLKDAKNVVRNVTFMTKAEDKVMSVAVSSIISRYVFIKEINKMGNELNILIPKGASSIVDDAGIMIVKKYGKEKLREIAKLNFSNTNRILNSKD